MTAEELNQHIHDGTIDEEVRVAEARQMKALSKIADIICGRPGLRLVLIAGGSSAGKTTTAKRICTQLMVDGRAALHLSTDDYFVGDARNPRDENGKLDYEHVECVDIPCLAADINALMSGGTIKRRRFDFVNHVPAFTDETDITLFSDHGRALVVHTSVIPAKTSRSTQGVFCMKFGRGKHMVTDAALLKDTEIKNVSRYRSRTIPAMGALIKEEDRGEEQMSLLD